jgi:outer membrane protein TolC
MSIANRSIVSVLLVGVVVMAGCSSSHYRRSADREAYGVINQKGAQVPNMDRRFTIEQTDALVLDGKVLTDEPPEFLGQEKETEQMAVMISLERSLEIAVKHSRIYQARKEQLYLEGLNLTLARHRFTPLFSGRGSGNYSVRTEQALLVGIDPATGQPRTVLSDNLVEQHRVNANGSAGADWLIRDVGRITAAFSTDFLRVLTGTPSSLASSQLGATFARPLLRNSGFKAEKETLTLAERTLLYGVRDFTRFRKDFTVQVATAYYGVLGNRDAARNAYLNYERSKASAERSRAMAEEGRVTQADLGRIQQQELTAESSWINALRAYKRSLDDFKILLGIPVDTKLVLDDAELQRLKIEHPDFVEADSLNVALAARLDYLNLKEQQEDAERATGLSKDALKMQVDLVASTAINSPQNITSGFPVPDMDRYRWNAGLNVDLALDRKQQRNTYRAALIRYEQARRAVIQREDEIKLAVRESWRVLEQARRTYEISELGVKLAERRVEEQELLAELGRAKAQDQVDAQNDLVNSRNQRTQALVSHTIARLQFWNNLGILYIKDNGQWEEQKYGKSN